MPADGSDEEIVTFRLPPRDRDAIGRLVSRGVYHNRSDFLRHAVRATLATHAEDLRPTLDLEMEGVELPDANARSPRQGASRSRSSARGGR